VQSNFEWDPAKARENVLKHRVSFERAAQVFLDPYMLSIEDEEHGEEEERWMTLGKDRNEIILVVSHTFRQIDSGNFAIRLISARRATRAEAKQYSTR
jgi:uncharacterized DUF497 family protein